MSEPEFWWRCSLGGMYFFWPHSMTEKGLAPLIRSSVSDTRRMLESGQGRREQVIALILAKAATGRTVPLTDLNIRPATDDELETWRRINKVGDVLKGKGDETFDQPSLL